jgi:bifunctional non-homologous end joining protein LigD
MRARSSSKAVGRAASSTAGGGKPRRPDRIAAGARGVPPTRFAPQLARLVAAPPSGDKWIHELKYDGFRIGCRIVDGAVQLLTRNGKDWSARFAAVADAAARLPVRNALLDGEVTVELPNGRTSFQALQNAGAPRQHGELRYFIFDLLYLDGEDLRSAPLLQRKARLQRLLRSAAPTLCFADHLSGDAAEMLKTACRLGAEGIVSKRADLAYEAGRGPGWLKSKCTARQELVIVGFTEPRGSRSGLGALLLATYDDDGALHFAGKVGTGFTQRSAVQLRARLDALQRADAPLPTRALGRLARDAHWVEPRLVAEIAFTEWTEDGKIRHPSFQGLREDKDPRQVRRETPATDVPAAPATHAPAVPAARPVRGTRSAPRATDRRRGQTAEIGGVTISHADRPLWPQLGISKAGLARYYDAVAPWMLPHLADRPLTLVRCPSGIGGTCFYMKHSPSAVPAGVRRLAIREKHKTGQYLIVDTPTALLQLVQLNVIEFHTWNAVAASLETPDRLVIDLDPGPAVPWPLIVEAAQLVRQALSALKLPAFLKTTGGRGLHVVVPLQPAAGWDECLAFARRFADAIAATDPRRYTTNFAKHGREKQILVDYLRNNRTSTSVAAYSVRARPTASVSVPLAWPELRATLDPARFTMDATLQRLRAQRTDPWSGYAAAAAALAPASEALTALR